jgi:hypothetical protein
MALALLGHALAIGGGAATSTAARNTTGAKLIVLAVTYVGATPSAAPTDSAGNTWIQGPSAQSASTNLCALYYCINPTTSATHTFSVSQSVSSIAVSYWSGAAPQKDKHNANFGNATTTTGSITPQTDGELLIAACSGGGGGGTGATAIDNGFTILQAGANNAAAFGLAHAYLFQTTAAPINPTWTGPGGLAAAILSFVDAVQLVATTSWAIAAAGALSVGANTLAATSTIRLAASGNMAQGFNAVAGLTVGAAAELRPGANRFAGASAWTIGAAGRLGNPAAVLAGTAQVHIATRSKIPTAHLGRVAITLDGVDVRARVHSVTVHDILNDAPNTCAITFSPAPAPPRVNQRLRVVVENNDNSGLLFAGTLQTVTTSYELKPTQLVYPCQAIDDTAQFNQRRPYGSWVNTSASTVALALCAAFAPAFETTRIAAGLPLVTITYDGSETMISALARLAAMIGAYTKVEDMAVYLFQTDDADPPDPIDAVHPFLYDPPIAITEDVSQQRTRVTGRGHGEVLLGDVGPGDTILPLVDVVMFNPAGGRAIASTTPDGAVSERLTYTGIAPGGAGALVGLGASPTVAPTAALVAGAGLGSGTYSYAYTFVTASGETLPSPKRSQITGPVDNTVRPPSTAVTITELPGTEYWLNPGDSFAAWVTFRTAAGETTISPIGVSAPFVRNFGAQGLRIDNLPIGPAGVTSRVIYMASVNSGGVNPNNYIYPPINDNTTTSLVITNTLLTAFNHTGQPGPPTNTAGGGVINYNQIAVAAIATGPAGTTGRHVYRTPLNGTTLQRLMTIADNTTTALATPDTAADAALGVTAPTADTSNLSGIGLAGTVLAGATSLITSGAAPFSAGGGWARTGNQLIRYAGLSGNTLTGIPSTGSGAILATIPFGDAIIAAAALLGVAGVTQRLQTGARVCLVVQRDDLAAQSTYGILEYLIVDERRAEASLSQLCDADLLRFARPLVTVQYATRDPKTKSGKSATFNLPSPPIVDTLTIQDVTITEINIAKHLLPRYTVQASSVRFSLEDILRQLAAAAEAS